MSLHDPFTLAMIALIGLSLMGLPIGLAMMTASIIYLGVSGQELLTVAGHRATRVDILREPAKLAVVDLRRP